MSIITALTLNVDGEVGYTIKYAGTTLSIAEEALIPTSFAWEATLYNVKFSLDEVSFKLDWLIPDPVIDSATEFKLDDGNNRAYLEALVRYSRSLEAYTCDGVDIPVILDA